MVELKMEKLFTQLYEDYLFKEYKMDDGEEDDFIGVYHPFPNERKGAKDINQLDLFEDYLPPKVSWWKRLFSKKNKKFLGGW